MSLICETEIIVGLFCIHLDEAVLTRHRNQHYRLSASGVPLARQVRPLESQIRFETNILNAHDRTPRGSKSQHEGCLVGASLRFNRDKRYHHLARWRRLYSPSVFPFVLHFEFLSSRLSSITDADIDAQLGPTSCGLPSPVNEFKIVDITSGKILAAKGVGEIYVKGPNVAEGIVNILATFVRR